MKPFFPVSIIVTSMLLIINVAYASGFESPKSSHNKNRSYGDAMYDLERDYPSPNRRYSRKELDRARRRANNSVWMDYYGHKDPIYQSNQYRGQGSSNYYPQPYQNYNSGYRNQYPY